MRDFSKKVGFFGTDFESQYDYALSFAGSDRDVAKAIADKLAECEIEVFYDENEQARILAENIEDYLAPIYRSGASFILVLFGPEYPQRIWTNFESKQFKDRFDDKRVIPIWFKNVTRGVFDATNGIGSLSFDRDGNFDEQIDRIIEILKEKIQEDRIALGKLNGCI
ncbi:MAG TPA: TIR domain-containing protein [Patescibacteria group bacterium]|nr:TIR domain-containing protein [Patescibacteria group bacterium]